MTGLSLEKVAQLKRNMTAAHREVLKQHCLGPVWDGNLASKAARSDLCDVGFLERANGWQFLTALGVRECIERGYLKDQDNERQKRKRLFPGPDRKFSRFDDLDEDQQ